MVFSVGQCRLKWPIVVLCQLLTETLVAGRVLAGVTVTPGGTAVRAASWEGLKVPVFWISTWPGMVILTYLERDKIMFNL